jgi:hypothetical protein
MDSQTVASNDAGSEVETIGLLTRCNGSRRWSSRAEWWEALGKRGIRVFSGRSSGPGASGMRKSHFRPGIEGGMPMGTPYQWPFISDSETLDGFRVLTLRG